MHDSNITTVADPIGAFSGGMKSTGIDSGVSTVKEGSDQTDSGKVTPGEGESSSDNAGGSKGSSEDSQSRTNGGRGRSKAFDIRELRQERRELRQQVNELQSMIQEIRDAKGSGQSANGGNAPPDFWTDPAGTLRSELANLRKELQTEMHQTREQDAATSQLNSERTEAVEFVRSQPGWSEDDETELVEIIHDYGLTAMQPMKAAKAALAILNQERGVGNRTSLKERASSMAGAPPAAGMRRQYAESEIDAILDQCERDPKRLTPELEKEIRDAYREGRVKK